MGAQRGPIPDRGLDYSWGRRAPREHRRPAREPPDHHGPLGWRPLYPDPARSRLRSRWGSHRLRAGRGCPCYSGLTDKSLLPVLRNPANRHKAVGFTPEQFHYAFANTLSREDSDKVYERYHIPAPGSFVWAGPLANFTPGHQDTYVNFRNGEEPLLFIAGEEDNLMPPAVNQSNVKHYRQVKSVTDYKEFEGRSHYTVGQDGWEEVADYALEWAVDHAKHPAGLITPVALQEEEYSLWRPIPQSALPRRRSGGGPGRPPPTHRRGELAQQGTRRRSLPGRAARDAAGARPLLADRLRLAQGRGEAQRLAPVHDRDRRPRHPLHPRALQHEDALPLIMTHGWPGSVIELLETVGPLTDPTAHGGTPRTPSPRAAVPARLRLLQRARRARLGRRPHRAGLGTADEPPRLHPLRRPGWRRGRPRHRHDGSPGGRSW